MGLRGMAARFAGTICRGKKAAGAASQREDQPYQGPTQLASRCTGCGGVCRVHMEAAAGSLMRA
jgi:hypothetical protein